jgi:hypothetical protein
MSYDQVVRLAELLWNNNSASREEFNSIIKALDNEGFVDILETAREVLHDNSGDDLLTKQVVKLIEYIYAEQSSRLVGDGISKFLNIFKK